MISILRAAMVCSGCGWHGVVEDCEPDVDGDGRMGCPECFEVVLEDEEQP